MGTSENIFGQHALPQRVRPARRSAVGFWVVVLLIAGTLVVTIDGLTRAPLKENQPLDSLTYDPAVGAFYFAAISLPLILLQGARERISKTEALLLWFVLGTVTYAKDFSYIKLPNAPVFITDVVLVLLMISLFVWPKLRIPPLGSAVPLSLSAFFLVGTAALARAVASGQDLSLSLRDYAMVVYAAFFFVGLYVVNKWQAFWRMGQVLLVGSILCTAGGLAWLVSSPGQRRYIGFSLAVAIALMMVAVMTIKRQLSLAFGAVLGLVLAIGVLIASMRTLYVALGVAALVFAAISRDLAKRVQLKSVLKGVALFLAVGVIAVVVLTQTKVGQDLLERESQEVAVGLLQPEQDDNAQFRLLAWAEAIDRFAQQPIIGEGFGVPFTFELADNDSRPHNTYLTVLYKMGLLGFLPLAWALGAVFVRAWKVVRASAADPNNYMLVILILSQVIMCVFGGLNLLLESPFLASLFWLNMGMIMRASRLLEQGTTMQGRTA